MMARQVFEEEAITGSTGSTSLRRVDRRAETLGLPGGDLQVYKCRELKISINSKYLIGKKTGQLF